MNTKKLFKYLEKNGGFTIGKSKDRGYAVGISNIATIPSILPISKRHIRKYNRLMRKDPSLHIGGWRHEGLDYYDLVRVFPNKGTALAVAKARSEKAIFSLHEGKEIFL